MAKLSIILYIAVGILILFLLSLSPSGPHNHHHHRHKHGPGSHRRLKLRSKFSLTTQDPHNHNHHHDPVAFGNNHNHHHDPVAFDPEVAELERHRQDKQWEWTYFSQQHRDIVGLASDMKQHQHQHQQHLGDHRENHHNNENEPEWKGFMDEEYDSDEEYLNDEDQFNVTNRLAVLFPKIDVDPVDGFVSEKELTQWNLDQALNEMLHRSKREMEVHDKNQDGFVSFLEYEPPGWVKRSDGNATDNRIGWWREEHFNASDMNGDGLLNLTEFNDFSHPAESKNPKLLQWLCNEEIRERDTDKDGKLNFNEFFHGLFDLVRHHVVEAHNSSYHSDAGDNPSAKRMFNQLDKDNDGFLTDTELLPVINKLHPSEDYYAKQQTIHVISKADNDKDGRLSLQDMIENPYVFYSSIFSDNDYDDYYFHDELR